MKITKKWLDERNACDAGRDWYVEQDITEPVAGIKNLITHDKLDWANWLIVRVMDYKQRVQYAVFAAEQVLDIYEQKYLSDDRPRKAIEAAKVCIKNPSDKNKSAALTAADVAANAADYEADYEARAVARAAALAAANAAADVAAYVARAAADVVANAAANAARATVYATRAAVYAAVRAGMKKKILNYGIRLLLAQSYRSSVRHGKLIGNGLANFCVDTF